MQRIDQEGQVLKAFADLRLVVGHFGYGVVMSLWSEIYGRQTEKGKWKEIVGDDC
jgi:hypothetical protein